MAQYEEKDADVNIKEEEGVKVDTKRESFNDYKQCFGLLMC